MRGSVGIYEGEELWLTEADIPFEKLHDPYGIIFWPDFKRATDAGPHALDG
jgi:alpha-glucosidase